MDMREGIKIIISARALIPFYILLFAGLFWLTRSSTEFEKNIPEKLKKILILLRSAACFLLVLALLNPVIRKDFLKEEKASLAVLVDQSASMMVRDADRRSRFEKARQFLKSRELRGLEKELDLKIFFFDSRLVPVLREKASSRHGPGGESTDIGNALLNVLSLNGRGPRNIILLSDGINTAFMDFSRLAQQLETRKTRLFALDVCGKEQIADISVRDTDFPEEAPVNSGIPFSANIQLTGYGSRLIRIRTFLNGAQVRSEQIRMKEGSNPYRSSVLLNRTGIHRITLTADAAENESILMNNSRTFFVRALKSRFRLLFLYGSPNFEYKFIKLALESDPHIELDARVNVKNGLEAVGDLNRYDCIITGNIRFKDLPAGLVRKMVRYADTRPGAMLFLAGRHSFRSGGYHASALKDIIPVEWGDSGDVLRSEYSLRLTSWGMTAPFLRITEDAAMLQETWNNLPPLTLINVVKSVKKGSRVLAVSSKQEHLVLSAIGTYKQCKVAVFTGFPTWKWGFLNAGLGYRENPFNPFWQQFVRYLVNFNQEKVSLFTTRLMYRKDEDIGVKFLFFNDNFEPVKRDRIPVTLSRNVKNEYRPSDRFMLAPSPVTPGLYEASLSVKEYGEYRLEADVKEPGEGKQTYFVVSDPGTELYRLHPDREFLRELCRIGKGRFLTAGESGRLTGLVDREKRRFSARMEKNIWENWIFLLLAVSLLCGEWFLRKRNGLM